MKDKKRILGSAVVVLLFLCAAGALWAIEDEAYNRPKPLMDYAHQELGIYDTMYEELAETDCRGCHGNTLADRHHATERVVQYGDCTYCHPTVEDPPGIMMTRNCTSTTGTDGGANGCHSWDNAKNDADPYFHGWHHFTDIADSGQCTACHNPNLLDEITPIDELLGLPYAEVTPHPFDCENCHWRQGVEPASGNPTSIGIILATQDALGCIITTNAVHGFSDGDKVFISNVPGMTEINGKAYYIVNVGGAGTRFRLFWIYGDGTNPVDSSGFTAYAGTATGKAFYPAEAGHPSTYNHFNAWRQACDDAGQLDCLDDATVTWDGDGDYYEYGKPIWGNYYNHHMGHYGLVAPTGSCIDCHGFDTMPDPDWDETNKELIRYCERCHGVRSLHAIYAHLGMVDSDRSTLPDYWWEWQGAGWEATGFHTATIGISEPWAYRQFTADGDDDDYSASDPPDPNIDNRDGMCWACHGSQIGPYTDYAPGVPAISSFEPNAGCCSTYVTLRGENFGETHEGDPARDVILTHTAGWTTDRVIAPVVSWTNSRIVFEVPCNNPWGGETFPLNLWLRVENEDGDSNNKVFTLYDCNSATDFVPDPSQGVCKTAIDLENSVNGQFGVTQTEPIDSTVGTSITRIVDFTSSAGTYTSTSIYGWSNTQIRLKFKNFYQDASPRNFCQDGEPDIVLCDGMALGNYNVYIRYIYFVDLNDDDELDAGDHIYQVENSAPQMFELTNMPWIFKRLPAEIPRLEVLKIWGANYGPQQGDGDVRIGLYSEARQNGFTKDSGGTPYPLVMSLGDPLDGYLKWTGTVIKVKMSVPWTYNNKIRWVWVEKDGEKSNAKPVKILPYVP